MEFCEMRWYARRMTNDQPHVRRALPTTFGILTLGSVGVLFLCDAAPQFFPSNAHALLATLPLVMITLTFIVYEAARRATRLEWAKTAILAFAFLFWAANQLCTDPRLAMSFNDIAIAGFVIDVFLVIIGWSHRAARLADDCDDIVPT